jgi:hypothetical protein
MASFKMIGTTTLELAGVASGHKLVYRPSGGSELYDYAADPREERNVFDGPQYGEVRRKLEDRLLQRHVRASDVVPHEPNPTHGTARPSARYDREFLCFGRMPPQVSRCGG